MANCSEVYGTYKIKARSHGDLVTIIEAISNIFGSSYYNTSLNEDDVDEVIDDPEATECMIAFTGSGRHCYGNNLDLFFTWIIPVETDIYYYSSMNFDELNTLYRRFNEIKDFDIAVEYVDFYPGSGLFVEEKHSIRRENGNDISENIASTDIDVTADNLIEYFIYSPNQAYDYKENSVRRFMKYNKEEIMTSIPDVKNVDYDDLTNQIVDRVESLVKDNKLFEYTIYWDLDSSEDYFDFIEEIKNIVGGK